MLVAIGIEKKKKRKRRKEEKKMSADISTCIICCINLIFNLKVNVFLLFTSVELFNLIKKNKER
jgi:hypothetical protein